VHSREAYQSLQEHVGDKLLKTVIRQSIAYAESSERAVSILDHRADLGADYVLLADELLGRLKLTAARRRLKPMFEAASNGGGAGSSAG
jgi:chromosome partitioning protein